MSQFGWDLYQKVAEDNDDNIFLSPLSLHTVLTMVYSGAEENTKTEMAEVLQLEGLSDSDVDTAYNALLSVLDPDDADDAQTELAIANKVYASDAFSFVDGYITNLQNNYQSELEEVSFASDPEGSRETINSWVSEQTNDKIPELLGDGTVNTNTVLVIVNAIYFLATWQDQFLAEHTAMDTFTVSEGDERQVEMMMREASFVVKTVSAFDDAQLLELPYLDGETSFFVLLPSEDSDLDSLEESFTVEEIQAAIEMDETAVKYRVKLPKFEMQQELNLRDLLISMGMRDAFGEMEADFSGISEEAQLYISEVVQKTYIKVNEKGTEAAAVSGVGISTTSAPMDFFVNRPFMFFIMHKPSGTILFMGRYVSPPASGEAMVVGRFYDGTGTLPQIDDSDEETGDGDGSDRMAVSFTLLALVVAQFI